MARLSNSKISNPEAMLDDIAAEEAEAEKAAKAARGKNSKRSGKRDDKSSKTGNSKRGNSAPKAESVKVEPKVSKPRRAEREAAEVTPKAAAGFLVPFKLVKETTGTYKYGETDENGKVIEDFRDAKIGTVYLRKSMIDGNAPRKITVAVRW